LRQPFRTFSVSVWGQVCPVSLAERDAQAQDKVITIGGRSRRRARVPISGFKDKQGIELAIEQLNKTVVNGYRFEVHYEDSACRSVRRRKAAKRSWSNKAICRSGKSCRTRRIRQSCRSWHRRGAHCQCGGPRSRSPIPATRGRFALCPTR